MTPFELFTKLQFMDKNTVSCLREDLEKIERREKLDLKEGKVVDHEVHARYMDGLDTLLELVSQLEGYDRNEVITFDISDLVRENPVIQEIVDSHVEEEVTTRWLTA